MKYINIECARFSCASSSHYREDSHIELVVEVDEGSIISQFSAKEILASVDIGSLLDEIGLLLSLDHFARPNGLTMEDFKAILHRAELDR